MSDSRASRPRVTVPYFAEIDLLPGVISTVISVTAQRGATQSSP